MIGVIAFQLAFVAFLVLAWFDKVPAWTLRVFIGISFIRLWLSGGLVYGACMAMAGAVVWDMAFVAGRRRR